jgi:hypothetical protein
MSIEQRLQLVIGFVKQNATSTQSELVDFLVSQGDTKTDAENAIPIYIQMLVSFGYIINATYEDMRDWGNTVSTEALNNASATLLNEYYKQVETEKEKAKLSELQKEFDALLVRNDEVRQKIVDNTDQDILDGLSYVQDGIFERIVYIESRINNIKNKL